MINLIEQNKKATILIISIVLLPLLVVGLYFTQIFSPKANVSAPFNIKTTRLTSVDGQVCFETDLPVESTLECSIGLDGAKFFCGKDKESATKHCIKMSDNDIRLNPQTGYYTFINTGKEQPALAYIPADPKDPTYSITSESYSNEEKLWLCRGEAGFDPALDINQDGCVNLYDMAYTLD